MSNIHVLQASIGNHGFFPIAERINEEYCKRHNYTFHLHTDRYQQDWPYELRTYWVKQWWLNKVIGDCKDGDYLLWLDCDAFVYGQELKIEYELIPRMSKTACVMFAADCAEEGARGRGYPKGNAGVFILEVCDWSRMFVTEWWQYALDDPYQANTASHDQSKLWTLQDDYPDQIQVLQDYYVMNGRQGYFIRHLAAMCRLLTADMMWEYVYRYMPHVKESIPPDPFR